MAKKTLSETANEMREGFERSMKGDDDLQNLTVKELNAIMRNWDLVVSANNLYRIVRENVTVGLELKDG